VIGYAATTSVFAIRTASAIAKEPSKPTTFFIFYQTNLMCSLNIFRIFRSGAKVKTGIATMYKVVSGKAEDISFDL
jgi:hypothetical protein